MRVNYFCFRPEAVLEDYSVTAPLDSTTEQANAPTSREAIVISASMPRPYLPLCFL